VPVPGFQLASRRRPGLPGFPANGPQPQVPYALHWFPKLLRSCSLSPISILFFFSFRFLTVSDGFRRKFLVRKSRQQFSRSRVGGGFKSAGDTPAITVTLRLAHTLGLRSRHGFQPLIAGIS